MKRLISNNWFLFLIVASVYSVLFLLGITCPIKYVFGISCPGCGMTRSLFSLIRFDFQQSWHYHPLAIYLVILLVITLLTKGKLIQRKPVWILTLFLFMTVYVYRLAFTDGDIVSICIKNSFLYSIFF